MPIREDPNGGTDVGVVVGPSRSGCGVLEIGERLTRPGGTGGSGPPAGFWVNRGGTKESARLAGHCWGSSSRSTAASRASWTSTSCWTICPLTRLRRFKVAVAQELSPLARALHPDVKLMVQNADGALGVVRDGNLPRASTAGLHPPTDEHCYLNRDGHVVEVASAAWTSSRSSSGSWAACWRSR